MRSRPLQDLLLPQAHFLYLQLQQCNKTSRGVQVLYSNRKGNDMQIVCLKEGVKHRWKSVDGKIDLEMNCFKCLLYVYVIVL